MQDSGLARKRSAPLSITQVLINRLRFRRGLIAVLTSLLVLAVLLDPYSFRESASDDLARAPLWQIGFAFLDILLIAWSGVSAWRGHTQRACLLLGLGTILNLAVAISQVHRDGIARFVMGYRAEEYLTWYLAALALRTVGLAWFGSSASRTHDLAE